MTLVIIQRIEKYSILEVRREETPKDSMQLEDYFEFVSEDDIRLKGHRVGIDNVLSYYLDGYTPEEIQGELNTLSLEVIYATITYYHHNRLQIDAYLKRLSEWQEQRYQAFCNDTTSPVIDRLRSKKAQRQPTMNDGENQVFAR